MPFLPDCVPRNDETVQFKKVNVMTRAVCDLIPKMVYEQFTEQNITRRISDTLWTAKVASTRLEEGLKMSFTCLGTPNQMWKLKASQLLIKFEDMTFTRSIVKSVGPYDFSSTNDTVHVSLTEEEILTLTGDTGDTYGVFLQASVTLSWTEQIGMEWGMKVRYEFHRRSENSSLVVEAGGKRFFVNLKYLSQLSHYFCALSRNLQMMPHDETTGLKLLKLEDVDFYEFEELLKVMYPLEKKRRSIDHKNLDVIMMLADRFQCRMIQVKCAKAMIAMKKICPARLLSLCEFYNMDWNVGELVENLSKKEIRKMIVASEFQTLSQRTVKLIAIRLSKLNMG